MNSELTFNINNDWQIETKENKLVINKYTLTDYHRRDYDYAFYSSIEFPSPADVRVVFNLITAAYGSGKASNRGEIKTQLEELAKLYS